MASARQWPAWAATILGLAFAAPLRAELTHYGGFVHDTALPHALYFQGEIDRPNLRDFRNAIRAHDITLLILESPGGRIYSALDLAGQIRARGIDTLIPPRAECASACAFLFMAGTRRQAAGQLGVHRFSSDTDGSASVSETEADAQNTVAQIIDIMADHGAGPAFFVRMFETPNSDMYWFTPEELTANGLTTGNDFAAEIAFWDAGHKAAAVSEIAAPAGLPAPGTVPRVGPGFDCATAGSATESAICADARLAALDLALSRRVERLGPRMTPMAAAALRVEQVTFLSRRNACGDDPACIEALYLERLEQLGY